MLKNLRKKIYNNKIKKNLEKIKFDYFAYYGDSPIPAFQTKQGNKDKCEVYSVFFPETEESLILAFSKLKKYYFKKYSQVTIQEFLTVYCDYFNFSEKTYKQCVEICEDKKSCIEAFKKERQQVR